MTKRKRPSNGLTEADDGHKRPRADNSHAAVKQSVSHGRVDPTSGQRSAIPGLDDHDGGDGDSDFEYGGEMADALSYLRAVRAEASTIPNLLVAPQPERNIYDNGVGDSRGFYEDGAYTAAPSSPSSSPSASDAQTKYYFALLARLRNLREQLQQPPPRHAVERLDKDHPRVFRGDSKDWKAWRWRLANTEPLPAQLAGMDRASVLRLLRLISGPGGCMAGRGEGIGGRASRWLWGLLARLPDVGELGSEEVGVVREVGKKAVWVGVGLKGVDVSGLDGGDGEGEEEEEVPEMVVEDGEAETGFKQDDKAEEGLSGGPVNPVIGPVQPSNLNSFDTGAVMPSLNGIQNDDPEALSAIRSRMLERLQSSTEDENEEDGEVGEINMEPAVPPVAVEEAEDDEEHVLSSTKVTVDMIITIVGELYGQRDLLEYREVWG